MDFLWQMSTSLQNGSLAASSACCMLLPHVHIHVQVARPWHHLPPGGGTWPALREGPPPGPSRCQHPHLRCLLCLPRLLGNGYGRRPLSKAALPSLLPLR